MWNFTARAAAEGPTHVRSELCCRKSQQLRVPISRPNSLTYKRAAEICLTGKNAACLVLNTLLEVVVNQAKKTLPALLLLVLVCSLRVVADEHPVTIPKDADSAKCLECHEEKGKGKAVHSAIQMGCTSCHEIKTEGETTNINLTAPKDQLCFTCHDKSKEDTLHPPYEKGQCITCHDPHTSDFPKQLRAEGNALCFECHAARPAGKADEKDVGLFGGKATMAKADFDQIEKIVPNNAVKIGHPFAQHPIADIPDPEHGGAKMNCLSCHVSHAASDEHLIAVSKTKGGDICQSCHQSYENKLSAESSKKYGSIEEKNRKEAEDRNRKVNIERPAAPQSAGDSKNEKSN
jgi:predicted CXXCH cytochrome family protein